MVVYAKPNSSGAALNTIFDDVPGVAVGRFVELQAGAQYMQLAIQRQGAFYFLSPGYLLNNSLVFTTRVGALQCMCQ